MATIVTYNVVPRLPAALEPMRELVTILVDVGAHGATHLFRHIDIPLWEQTKHNPLRLLQLCKQARLVELADDEDFLRELQNVHERFKAYWRVPTPMGSPARVSGGPIAYFSAEYGFHESFPKLLRRASASLYGDHCKSASDLDLNFVAVGLLLPRRLFQAADQQGWLEEACAAQPEFHHLPLREVKVRGATA